MKFNVEVDVRDIYSNEEFIEELNDVLMRDIVKVVAQDITRSWDFDRLRNEIKREMTNDIISMVIKSIESKKDFYERVFKVKDFSELNKKNEDYLIELIDKAIVKKFKQ